MKVIIAGSRNITSMNLLNQAIADSGFEITEVVSGGAKGADQLGEQWAIAHDVPCKKFLPDWGEHGKAAGPIRNRQMAAYADALIALWDGKSRGTLNMIAEASAKGLKVFVLEVLP